MIQLIDRTGGRPLCQLKIRLLGFKPPIWRRVVVTARVKLDVLHRVIQTAMGWTDSHMHQFVAGEVYYGQPDAQEDGRMLNEKRHTLADLAPTAKTRFIYEYDFGDSWEHEVLVEKILPPDASFKHPFCVGGANACPPEDCGGCPGYAEFLEAMDDPNHERHEEFKEWIGGDWDARGFSPDDANAALKRIKA